MKKLALLVSLCAALSSVSAQAQVDPWSESYRLEAAFNYVGAIAQLEPMAQKNNEFALLRTGYLQYMQGKFKDSVVTYQRALSVNPESIDGLLGISLPLMAQLQWADATAYLNKVLKVAPWNYTASLRLLTIEEIEKKWKVMGDHAQDLVRHYPSDATSWVYVARAEAWQNRADKAVDAYRQVLAIVPKHIEATNYLKSKGK